MEKADIRNNLKQAESKGADLNTPSVCPSGQPSSQSQETSRGATPGMPMPLNAHAANTRGSTREENYILKVCRALMMYGAPTHRLEEYMHSTARKLGLHLQSFYLPGCMIISFDETSWSSAQVHIVRCTQALNLAKLYDVHAVYKDIIHERISVDDATARINHIMNSSNQYPRWFRVLSYGLASMCIGPVSYGARPIDLPIILILGLLLGFMELVLANTSELYAHIFETTGAIMTAFLGRAFGSISSGHGRTFCFSAISQASLVLILPGFIITTSALELQSKNVVSGSVRMVYAIIYTLFLAFGFTIGVILYGAMDSNATSATKCETTWPFWWQVIFVPPFTFFYIIVNQGRWSKIPAMLVITLAGWIVNHFSGEYFVNNLQIAQTLGALTVGILANLCSRLGHGLAVALLHPAIFILVPGSFAASGSLISSVQSADQLITQAGNKTAAAESVHVNSAILSAGYSMVEIAIGITVGLSVSALVIYPFRRRGKSGLFSF